MTDQQLVWRQRRVIWKVGSPYLPEEGLLPSTVSQGEGDDTDEDWGQESPLLVTGDRGHFTLGDPW